MFCSTFTKTACIRLRQSTYILCCLLKPLSDRDTCQPFRQALCKALFTIFLFTSLYQFTNNIMLFLYFTAVFPLPDFTNTVIFFCLPHFTKTTVFSRFLLFQNHCIFYMTITTPISFLLSTTLYFSLL